ncbi:MAG TPA: hypothetical protein HPQ03_04040 [Deltaproteobacteria bacterium]|nr:hypothetical protein [Deltaproteobacteria bacterium]
MNEEDPRNPYVDERTKQISVVRKEILSLPPEEALDRILEAPEPRTLVRSFPTEDLYYLLNDIGPEDALPLLKLASDEQWEFILDLEIWEKDRVELQSVTRWLNLLMAADSPRAVRWFIEKKREMLELFLFRNIELKVREWDQDPSEMGEEVFTLDDNFYIRVLDTPLDPETDYEKIEEKNTFIKRLMDKLADFDHVTYQHLLLESSGVIPAEAEEEAYRFRNIRLAEKGFLPFEEAVGVYQSLAKEEIFKTGKKFMAKEAEGDQTLPVPVIFTDMLEGDNLFTSALKQIGSMMVLQQLQSEFAGLCNQTVVADQKSIKSKAGLKPVVRKVSGYLHLGLEELTSDKGKQKLRRSVELIQDYPLNQIFRIGYGLALSLKWRVEAWRKQSWFESQKLPLSFWGEDWLGVLGGLLLKKPLFFDNYRSGHLYREFAGKQDIDETAAVLEEIVAFDHLLSLMAVNIARRPDRFLTHKSVILTLWVRNVMELSDGLDEIALKDFRLFLDKLFEPKEAIRPKQPCMIRTSMKTDFLKWLSEKSGMDRVELSTRLGKALENLFFEIEEEYGSISKKDVDPRFIRHFLVSG